ncbi:unnamed protein product [Coccothraustes coccothraustes]
MSMCLPNVPKDGESTGASLAHLCQCSAASPPHLTLPMLSETRRVSVRTHGPLSCHRAPRNGAGPRLLCASSAHTDELREALQIPYPAPATGPTRRPPRLKALRAHRSRPARPQRWRPPGPAARDCSVPSPPEQPRAHGGTERSDGPRAGPGQATPPPAPARGLSRPGGSAGPERGGARLGKRLQTERHSSRQGKHRGNTAGPLPQQTLTHGAASLPGARCPPHHVPAAANRGTPRPAPARPGPTSRRERSRCCCALGPQ